jgi:P-type E1-E2 ATPase
MLHVSNIQCRRWKYNILAYIFSLSLASLGFHEEYKSKKALNELSNSLENEAVVVRDGETKSIPTKDLVPGDILYLVGGNLAPADVQWIKGDKMSIDMSEKL